VYWIKIDTTLYFLYDFIINIDKCMYQICSFSLELLILVAYAFSISCLFLEFIFCEVVAVILPACPSDGTRYR